MEKGGVEIRFRSAALVTKDDVVDLMFASDVWWRGGVTLQPAAMRAVRNHLCGQEP